MAFLTINGLTVPARNDTAPFELRGVGGEDDLAYNGTPILSRQRQVVDISFESTPLSLSDALAWAGLISGEGEVWSFDSTLYGSKGLGPNSATGLSVGTGKISNGLNIAANSPARTAVFEAGLPTKYAVLCWYKLGAGSWAHYVVQYTGSTTQKWVDGTRNDAASTSWLTVSSSVTLTGDTVSITYVDDLVVLPYCMPTSWPAIIYARTNGGTPFSALYNLAAGGDAVWEGGSRTVIGVVKGITTRRSSTGVLATISAQLKAV